MQQNQGCGQAYAGNMCSKVHRFMRATYV